MTETTTPIPQRRLGRRHYWLWMIVALVLLVAVPTVLAPVAQRYHLADLLQLPTLYAFGSSAHLFTEMLRAQIAIGAVVLLVLILPYLFVAVRRRHDRGRSGMGVLALTLAQLAVVALVWSGRYPEIAHYAQLAIIPFTLYTFIVLAVLPGTPGANRYGSAHTPAGGQATHAPIDNAILGAPPPPKPLSAREAALSSRMPRARFIGHAIGYLILIVLVVVGMVVAGFTAPQTYHAIIPGYGEIRLPYVGLVPWVVLLVSALAVGLIGDLAIRRRHDRGQSGADVAIWLALFFVSQVLMIFDLAPTILPWMQLLLLLEALYLVVVIVFLRGTKGPNRYGADPVIA